MRTRAVLLAATAALALTGVVQAQAAPPLPSVTLDTDSSDGSVGAGTSMPGQPLVGARYNTTNGTACVGFSYQVPFCTTVGGG